MKELEIVEIFVDSKAQHVNIICPKCDASRQLETDKLNPEKKQSWNLDAQCQKCGLKFKISFNFRQFYRKGVDILGGLDIGSQKLLIAINNISMSGIGFSLETPELLHEGKTYTVAIRLDDNNRTVLQRKIQVITIRGSKVGARFQENKFYDKELGFYLMS